MDRDELQRRWAPTLRILNVHDALRLDPPPPPPEPTPEPDPVLTAEQLTGMDKAFVATVGGRTIIAGRAEAASMPTARSILDQRLLKMSGRFVGGEVPNRNGAMWSAGDLEMAQGTVVNGPLNWLHEERHVIGTLTSARFVPAAATELSGEGFDPAKPALPPHIAADAVIWRWIWPDEAYVVQQASEQNKLWYSMECISESIECSGESGCGRVSSYDEYIQGASCEHVQQRASVRRFIKPVFLGGAVIVPPVRPGWAEADAAVLNEAASLAPGTFEQAGNPDVSASEWEQLMAQVVRFART